MTESEIIKALEICSTNDTNKHYMLTYHGIPLHILFEATLDLLLRKNAEIERLTKERYLYHPDGKIELLQRTDLDEIRAEAVNEFSERVSLYWLQFVIDEIRKFATKAGLDPVSSFNPTEKELNEKYKVVLEWLDHIKKEKGVE